MQFHLYQWTERPHWTGDGNKTCTVTFKILNNSGFEITRLAASLHFRDGYDDTVKQVFLTEKPLPDDTASGSGRTPPMFGSCDEIEIIGIRDVLRCDMPGRSFDECRAMLDLKLPDKRI